MCLKFVVADIDEDSERALGVFHAVWNLRDAGKLYATKKNITIRFAGGSMKIWRSRRALQFPSPRSIARRAERFRGSKTAQLSTLRERTSWSQFLSPTVFLFVC
jgi:hypothetical protein